MIGILFAGNLRLCPYIAKYTNDLENRGIKYEIINWDRDNSEHSKLPENVYSLNFAADKFKNPLLKSFDFIKFRKFALDRIIKQRYEKLIILNAPTGIFLFDFLTKNYKNKYWIDYRDYSYEYFKPYYWVLKLLIQNAAGTVISSRGFLEELPKKNEYIVTHNYRLEDIKAARTFIYHPPSKPLNITYMGGIRYYDHLIKFIEKFEKDDRFIFNLVGESDVSAKINEYITRKGYKKTRTYGRYTNDEKSRILEDVDAIFNCYSGGRNTQIALSNKLYDGIIYKIPQIVNVNTYSEKIVDNFGVGIGLDIDADDAMDKLYEYITNLDRKQFELNCTNFLDVVLKEDEIFLKKLREFIS